MKSVLAVTMLLFGAASGVVAQPQSSPPPQQAQTAASITDVNAILAQVQKVVQAINTDIGRLRIDKWKTDGDQRQQLRQVADSLQRNITSAMPSLISDVQAGSGNVSTTFKLYHNINVLYEFLSSLADAAGSLGKKEEYEPLASDASALDSVRQGLSAYIEQAALKLESVRPPASTPASTHAATPPTPKKIVIDDDDTPKKTVKPRKKKTSSASPQPTPVPL